MAMLAAISLAAVVRAPMVRGQEPLPHVGPPNFGPPPRPRLFLPEQKFIEVRPPEYFAGDGVPELPPPQTVASVAHKPLEMHLSLDDAIHVALENSEVIRVLTGVTAVSSGQTIYDVAITNTTIDEELARFDPTFEWRNAFNRFEPPIGVPGGIAGTRTNEYDTSIDVFKTMQSGGTLGLAANVNPSRFHPGIFAANPLDPQTSTSLDLSFTQPLYRGGGLSANRAPIVVARIDTERSYAQYKDSVQGLVRGVIEAYWSLVFARTDQWARQQQVLQAEFAYNRADARFRTGDASRRIVAQARVSLGGFKANLTAAQNNVLQREAALRNMLGLPPADGKRIVPTTPPFTDSVAFDWYKLLALADQNRPDLIAFKLAIEANEQRLLLARNQAHPAVDATMLYRWNGLSGRTSGGTTVSSRAGQFTDWTLGVNVSMPLSLRQERAAVRRQELMLARDRANLGQATHEMTHILATTLRDLEQFYQQYQEFRAMRTDALLNLQENRARWDQGGVGGISYVDLLLAITDWGNTISSEAQALAQYNTGLANLEREAGTILEAHGVRFVDERFASVGPFGFLICPTYFPASTPTTPNAVRYPAGNEPSEEFFELDDPLQRQRPPEELPRPDAPE